MPTSSGMSGASPEDPFYPPRASAGAGRWRRAARPVGRLAGWLGARLRAILPDIATDSFLCAVFSIIPGLGHYFVDCRARMPEIVFGVYALLLVWTVGFGTGQWSWMILFSYHAWAVSDAFARSRARMGKPRLTGMELVRHTVLVTLMLGTAYALAGRMIRDTYGTVRVTTELFAPDFHRDDRVLVLRRASYQRGDLVYSNRYEAFERIMAGPGDKVSVSGGVLFVNGSASSVSRLSAEPLDPKLEKADLVVPKGRYCIFFPSRSYYLYGNRLLEYYMIPAERIDGEVVARYYPWWR